MNLPNFITLCRILMIPFFISFLVYNYNLYAFGVFLLAGISDALDGFIARTSKKKTRLGTILDPMADKLLLSSSFLTMTIIQKMPAWVSIIVISRDIIIIIGALMLLLFYEGLNISPSILGKGTTLFQILYVILTLLFLVLGKDVAVLSPLLWITIGLTVVSGIQYIYIWFKLLNSNDKQS